MALPKIGFNEGSLLRRTLLHVGTFVVGSAAFIGVMSFVLVSVAKGVVSPRAEGAEDGAAAIASAGVRPPPPGFIKPGGHPAPRRPPVSPSSPSKDD